MLLRVTAEFYCAGCVLENDRVVRAAPILSWAMGWSYKRLLVYLARHGRHCEVIDA